MKKRMCYWIQALLLISSIWIHVHVFGQEVKGLYVNGFAGILGNVEKEDSLLRFASNNGFNYLTLYQMHVVHAAHPLTDTVTSAPFRYFVRKAKSQFGIAQIGVATESFEAFRDVYHVYNQLCPDSTQRIDVYNLEFEFWVSSSVEPGGVYCNDYLQDAGYSCDTAGGFDYFVSMLHRIDSLAESDGVKSEVYFGWFNDGQAQEIMQTGVDRILLSAYIPSSSYSAEYVLNYLSTRLQRLTANNSTVQVMPLFSAEPDFMQDWVSTHAFFEPYSDFLDQLNQSQESWSERVIPGGIQWFAYSWLPKINMDLGVAESPESLLKLYPNPASGVANCVLPVCSGELEVYDLTGTRVYSEITSGGSVQLHLRQGVYQVRFRTKAVCYTVRLVMI